MIRPLGPDDAGAFLALRIEALENAPGAFASSADDERRLSRDQVEARLRDPSGDRLVLGAWEGGLVGMVGLARERGAKLRHRATLWGLYVQPDARRKGWAQRLVGELLDRARDMRGLEQVELGVSVDNGPALALYSSLGFQKMGCELRAIKLGENYIDEDKMIRVLP